MQSHNNQTNNIFEGNPSFIIKINLDKINDINNLTNFNIPSNNIDEIIYMNKAEYSKYVFNNSGTLITKFKTNNNCSICSNSLKYTHKLYKLNECDHLFHSKCIKKWFKYTSDNFHSIHQCPLCRSSSEIFV